MRPYTGHEWFWWGVTIGVVLALVAMVWLGYG